MNSFYDILDEKEIAYQRTLKKIAKFLKKYLYLLLTSMAILTIYGMACDWNGGYLDGDGYMRLIRVKNWILNPTFWEQRILVSNYPFGEILHWTRPVDFLWLVSSSPFFSNFSIDDALFLGGAFLSPLLCIGTIISFGYGIRRHFNIWLIILGGALFLNNNIIIGEFSFYKADHHSFMIFLSFYSFSSVLCWLKKREKRYLFGIALGLSIASLVMIDGIIFALLFLGYFLYLYLFKNISLSAAYKFFSYYTILITIFWGLNPPFEGYLSITNGRLSFLFVLSSWLLVLALYILKTFHIHTFKLKITSLLCASSLSGLFIVLIFGKDILANPVKKEIFEIWGNQIIETLPIWRHDIGIIIKHYFMIFIALILNIYLLTYTPRKEHKRILLLNIIVGGAIFVFSLLTIRFYRYFPIFELLPWLCLIDRMYKNSDYYIQNSAEFPMRIYTTVIIIFFMYLLVLLPHQYMQNNTKHIDFYNPHLITKIRNIGGTLLTDTFLSPRYVFQTNVNTISTPYHNNVDGITTGVKILFSENDEEITPLILKHQIKQILLFDNYNTDFYNMDENNQSKLYWRLIKKERIPSFLKEIHFNNSPIRLYKLKDIL